MAATQRLVQQVLDRLGTTPDGEADQVNIAGLIQDQYALLQTLQRRINSNNLIPNAYYGHTDEDPYKFLDKFNTYCDIQEINVEHKPKYFRLLLAEQSEVWVTSLIDGVRQDWDQLSAAFLVEFAGESIRFILEQTLEERKQKEGEKTNTYISEVLRITQYLQKEEHEVCRILVKGLLPEIKRFVIGSNPKTLTETVQKIRLAETVSSIQPESLTVTPTVAGISTEAQVKGLAEQLKKEVSLAMIALIRKVREKPKKDILNRKIITPIHSTSTILMKTSKDNSRISGDSNSRKGNYNNYRGNDIECFYCHLNGHRVKECRVRKNRSVWKTRHKESRNITEVEQRK
jgi:hypothetical protein